MDTEKGAPTIRQEKMKGNNCCYKVFLAVALAMGVVACALSIATLTIQLLCLHHHKRHTISPSVAPHYTPQQEKKLLNEVAQYLHDSEYNETKSKRSARQTDCSSLFDSTLTVKPSAHLAGNSLGASKVVFKDSFFRRQNPVLSVGWSCQSDDMCHVLGGMKYNARNGFLKIPTDGIYYVYSQILMNVSSPDTKRPTKLGHITVKCTCSDEAQLDGNCYCYTMQDSVPYNDDGEELMQSYSWDKESSGGSTYHGGLFRLTANSYIGIVPVISDRGSPQTSIIATTIDSFFGAFYVTGLTAPSPSPSPSGGS